MQRFAPISPASRYAVPMPARNHSSAPKFDPARPRDLPMYFQELELLLASANIVDHQAKKEHARRYLQYEDFELWGTIPEYHIPTAYDDFKNAIMSLYPGATDERRYSVADVHRLVAERSALGIHSLEDLSAYFRQFLVITAYLLQQGRMAEVEQQHLFIRGFQPSLISRVAQRLQLKDPDHHPDDPFSVQDVFSAAQYALQGSTFFPPAVSDHIEVVSAPVPTAALAPQSSGEIPRIQAEGFFNSLSKMARSLADTVSASLTGNQAVPVSQESATPLARCSFCADPSHFIKICPVVDRYVEEGKVQINQDSDRKSVV